MLRQSVRAVPALFAPVAMVAIVALTAGAAGCGSTPTQVPSTPTTPSVLITETYLGTVPVNGAAIFSFGVTASGITSVTATYKSMAPATGAAMGLALGIWNGASCQVVIDNNNAVVNTTVVGSASAAGTLCVRAYDNGNLTGTQTVELSITHF